MSYIMTCTINEKTRFVYETQMPPDGALQQQNPNKTAISKFYHVLSPGSCDVSESI